MLGLPFYVISDTHFFHKNIVKYCDRPYDHEVMMVKRWRRAIKESDTVLHLGDVFFGGQTGYERYRDEIAPQLPGKKYLILGNHDKRTWDWGELGFTVIKPFKLKYRNYTVTFDHYPKLLNEGEREVHIHGHIHNHGYAREISNRWGNVNMSVEVLNYRPHRMTRLLNKEIRARNQSQRYHNSKAYRCHNGPLKAR